MRMPSAIWTPLPENNTQPAITPTQIIVHTAVDSVNLINLYDYFRQAGVGAESHFWIRRNGTIYQGVDSEIRADANVSANRRPDGTGAISIETEDDGDPEGNPWTKAQMNAIIEVCKWAIRSHPRIEQRRCRNPTDPGLGWHSMWGYQDPINLIGPKRNPWTTAFGKTCPGKTRIRQHVTIIEPAVIGSTIGGTMPVYPSFRISTMQNRLIELGYSVGAAGADGIWGPDTDKAVEKAFIDLDAYQSVHEDPEATKKANLLDQWVEAFTAVTAHYKPD